MKINKKNYVSFLLGAILMLGVGCNQVQSSQPSESPAIESTPTVENSTNTPDVADKTPVVTETLPIGSVVTVDGSEEKYMVIAHDYIVEEMPDITWQYAACLYPEGNISAKPAMAFNNEDIKEVLFEGLKTTEGCNLAVYEVKEGYLPLGTVVQAEGLETPLMIFGRSQQLSGTEQKYDYAACEYPAGNISPEETYVLNNEDISSLYFLGYIDDEEEAFKEKLLQAK